MASNHTNVQGTNQAGSFSITNTTTEAPILPAGNIEHLQRIDPKFPDWVIEQTAIEAEYRRETTKRINLYIFLERMAGPVIGGLVATVGLGLGAFLILRDHDWAGVALCGTTLVSLVSVILKHKPGTQEPDKPPSKTTRKKS